MSKIDYQTINAIFDTIAPLIRAHGQDKTSVELFTFYLLVIAAAMAEEVDIDCNKFSTLAVNAFETGKNSLSKLN